MKPQLSSSSSPFVKTAASDVNKTLVVSSCNSCHCFCVCGRCHREPTPRNLRTETAASRCIPSPSSPHRRAMSAAAAAGEGAATGSRPRSRSGPRSRWSRTPGPRPGPGRPPPRGEVSWMRESSRSSARKRPPLVSAGRLKTGARMTTRFYYAAVGLSIPGFEI